MRGIGVKLKTTYSTYIRKVIKLVKNVAGKYLVSVLLFGSVKSGTISLLSDVDLVFVMDDSTPKHVFRYLDAVLFSYEIKNGLWVTGNSFFDSLKRALNVATGMYKSHFICRYSDLKNKDFSRIFNTPRLMSKLLAPKCLVLRNFFRTAKVIYGKDVLSSLEQEIKKLSRCSYIDWVKSLFMNLFLSLGALVASIFSKEFFIYSVEAIKWSMYGALAICQYSYDISTKDAIRIFGKYISNRFVRYFIEAKYRLKYNVLFLIEVPFNVFKIHLSIKNLLSNRNKHML